jgi:hypothetical protein
MTRDRRLALTVAFNLAIVAPQFVFGLRSHSLGPVRMPATT